MRMPRLAAILAVALFGCDMPDMGEATDGGPGDGASQGDGGFPFDDGMPAPLDLRINHMQMRATVNSYHEFTFDYFPESAYRHPRPAVQLVEQGIRVFDFDIIGDRSSWFDIRPGTAEWSVDRLNNCGVWEPGNMRTGSLVPCLRDLRNWSNAHPEHPLLIVMIGETDLGNLPPQLIWQLDRLDEVITVGLDRERLLTPADIRGEHPTVWDAIQANGWPTVDETRGKVMVVLNDRGPTRFAYLMNGGLDPDDQLMFVVGDPATAGQPAVRDEVVFTFEPADVYDFETDMAHLERMQELVEQGFLVHAITDDADKAARMTESGVHMVGTRFPMDVLGPLDARPIRCNPLTAPEGCRAEMFELMR